MNIRQLEHLLALAETGSFSRAADGLHMTQSALSRSIQALESDFGGRLLDRIGKRNELTPLGRQMVERARPIVRDAAELRRAAHLFQRGDGGDIRVGLGSGPGALLMTPFLRHMAEHHPGVRVGITRGPTELQIVQLRARQLDALVVDARRVAPAPDLNIEALAELRAGFVARADHPLAKLKSVSLHRLLDYPLASTPLSDEVARLLVEQFGSRADPKRMTTLQCEDVTSLIDTVSATRAVFLGVIAAAREALREGRLAELRMNSRLKATARFAYLTLFGRTEAPAMSIFRRFVARHLRD